jgi:hypothetical protein
MKWARSAKPAKPASRQRLERRISEALRQMESTLALLLVALDGDDQAVARIASDSPKVDVETVALKVAERRLRMRFFDGALFADPAWDMLLDLFRAELAGLEISVSSLCIASGVPATTALRWIEKMIHGGLCLRRADSKDGRRSVIGLTPYASKAMQAYFGQLESLGQTAPASQTHMH